MTIILGFTCHDALVIASDSQSSYFPTTSKRPDIEKVAVLKLKDGRYILTAKAGVLNSADCFLEILEAQLAEIDVSKQRAIADAAEVAMEATKRKFILNMKEDGFDSAAIQQRIKDYLCYIILGYIHDNKPYIYSLDLEATAAVRNRDKFIALGCAANVASAVLTGHDLQRMSAPEAVGLAAYAVETCKDHDLACCGRTQMGILVENGKGGHMFSEEASVLIAEAAKKTTKQLRAFMGPAVAKNMDDAGIMRVAPQSPK